MMKSFLSALRLLAVLTVITGAFYPAFMLMVGETFFPAQAHGSLLYQGEKIIGSALLAQKFELPEYFHPRPSAVDYATVASGASNLSPSSNKLRETVAGRQAALEAGSGREMLFASGSGLDPEISPQSARAQAPRVAEARGLPPSRVLELVEAHLQKRFLGFMGQERVNVLRLNLALDALARS